MPHRAFALLLVVFALFAVPGASKAYADDENFLPDGGSLVTTTDGGSNVTVYFGSSFAATCRKLSMRPEGAQSTRYKLCTTSSCTANSSSAPLDYDVHNEIEVNCKPNNATNPKRYLALTTDDGGIPYVKVWLP